MKHLFVYFILITLSFQIVAQSNIEEAKNILERKGEVCVIIDSKDKDEIENLAQYYIIDKIQNAKVYLYLLPNDIEEFISKYPNFEVFKPKFENSKANSMAHSIAELKSNWDKYPTYDVYVALMNEFATNYPSICKLENIGQSVEGRDLRVLKISDNVNTDEIEPEFFYTSTMHGDETTGYVLLLRFIDYLLSNYESNEYVAELIDNIEIYINPLANPDGTYATSNDTVCYYCSSRTNANGVDLNRNFTEPRDAENPAAWQIETANFIDFQKERHFTLSMNFHGGYEVINYPWDFTSTRHADDAWFQLISREYADTVHQYAPSTYLDDENNGITNGYDWYYAGGTRQDYMNFYLHGREVTAEISTSKAPESSTMPNYWEYNYRSLLNYMKQTTYGVHGVVTDANTGNPIQAFISIENHDKDSSQVYSSATNGDYHRLIKAGTYTFLFTANGYDQVSSTITINDYETLIHNVQLFPQGTSNYPPKILNGNGQEIDTVSYVLKKDSVFDFHFKVSDPNDDEVILFSFESLEQNTTLTKINDTAIRIIPKSSFTGNDWVKIVVSDNGTPVLKDSAFIFLEYRDSVNNAPQILTGSLEDVDSVYFNVFKDSIIDFNFNIYDVDDDSTYLFSLSSLTGNSELVKNNDTSITIIPNTNFIGKELVKIVVSDTGALALTDSIFIQVQYIETINHAPRIVNNENQEVDSLFITTFKDSTIQIPLQVIDIDNDEVQIASAFSLLDYGIVSFENGSLVLSYYPPENFIGYDLLKVMVKDNGSPVLYDSATVAIHIIEFGDNPPVIVDEENNSIDTYYTYTFADTGITICLNAIDADNDNLSLLKWESIYHNGIVQLSESSLCFNYSPNSNFVGIDKFIIWVVDDSEFELTDSIVVTIAIKELGNNPPVIVDINGNEISEIFIEHNSYDPLGIQLNVMDIDEDIVTMCQVSSTLNIGTITEISDVDKSFVYNPKVDFTGIDTVKVLVCDNSVFNLKDSVLIRISVDPNLNHPPLITDELGFEMDTLNVGTYTDSLSFICLNAFDPDGDNVAITDYELLSGNGTIRDTSYPLCYTYQSLPGFYGYDYYKVIVCDDNETPLCDTLVVKTTVMLFISVEENQISNIVAYPNPFNDILHIKLGNNKLQSSLIRLYTITGQLMLMKEYNATTIEINTANLNQGIYFMLIQQNDRIYKIKMIKQF